MKSTARILVFIFFTSCSHQTKEIPLSQVAKKLNMKVYWNPEHDNVYLKKQKSYYIFADKSSRVFTHRGQYKMSAPAVKKRGEIFIPQKFLLKYRQHCLEDKQHFVTIQKKTAKIPQVAKKIIIIDAGHGGKHPGAVNQDIHEKDLNLLMARYISEPLKKKYGVRFTRTADSFISLSQRVTSQSNAALFLSIHFNAATNKKASGFEAWISTQGNKQRLNKSNRLAQKILKNIAKDTALTNRGIRIGDFYVLKNSTVPAVLLECGFISNENDLQWFLTPKNIQKFSQSVARAIDEYLEIYE
ncbi:N-acetylmuramoyl-L-alanine amidase [Candidatus Uabimicrobium sp. HlEnr_7]|uniref:N-acetylmuramoyl-L-alanine amidase n=1 Tax=Candidatus Uabimicrobium helgolandensis TaxID=3095367 RepID=UPI003557A7E4